MSGTDISRALSFAALALVGVESTAEWEVDSSHLSYSESDDRVSVSKTLIDLTQRRDQTTLSVGLVNDTMSGASPTGAIRSSDSAVTYTGASGSAATESNYAKSHFDDQRRQVSLGVEHRHENDLVMNYGGAVSRESDFDSFGVNISAAKTTRHKAGTYLLGLAYTQDTIYRSDTGTTPEPLSNMQSRREYSEGERTSVEALLGYTHVLNRRTLAQMNMTVSRSQGYHTDPYKIISAADANDRILANFYEARPDSRLRTSLFGKLVHQRRDSKDSLHTSYRFYLDDWGVSSHTVGFRYRHVLSDRQYIEPAIRLYSQSDADFYQRKLQVDEGNNPVIPDEGIASADYRLDSLRSTTLGINYGFSPTPATRLRLRAEYLAQRFSTADFSSMSAVILQASFSISF